MTAPWTPESTWDIGDHEPVGVTVVEDYMHGWADEDSSRWDRTTQGGWKGYKDGGKRYLKWAELVRRWGPVTAAVEVTS
jgi:hypothetical protein